MTCPVTSRRGTIEELCLALVFKCHNQRQALFICNNVEPGLYKKKKGWQSDCVLES